MIYIVVVDTFCKILKALNEHLQEVARTQESSVNDQENLGLCNLVCVCEGSRVGDEEGIVWQVKKKVVGKKKGTKQGRKVKRKRK